MVCPCRSEMTKIFPSDSEPPEETVELWTGGRGQQQQQHHLQQSKQQRLLRLLRCISEHTDPATAEGEAAGEGATSKSRLNSLFGSLLCLQAGTCPESAAVETSVVEMVQCYEPQCAERCSEAEDFSRCIGSCLRLPSTDNGEEERTLLHTILKRRAPNTSLLKRHSISDIYSLINQVNPRDPRDTDLGSLGSNFGLSRGVPPKRTPGPRGMSMIKRYRLGLYDCISSYCGQLSGADRKSCIINYCHRSTTIKMK